MGTVNTENGNYFAVGLSNGQVKLYNCKSGAHLVDIQAHSRSVNALICHPTKPIFVTVSDDTFVNVWYAKASKDTITDIELVMS
jgi:WD40 repeat protein